MFTVFIIYFINLHTYTNKISELQNNDFDFSIILFVALQIHRNKNVVYKLFHHPS